MKQSIVSRFLAAGLMVAASAAPALAEGAPVVTIQHTQSVPSAAALASPTSLFVECPSGYVAVSGGLDSTSNDLEVVRLAPTFGATAENLVTALVGTQSAPTGWMAAVRNLSTTVSRSATVTTVCAQLPSAVAIVASATASAGTAADPSFGGAIPDCPAGTTAIGGGVDVANPSTMTVTSNSPRGVGGIRGYLSTLPAGTLAAPVGWSGFARNVGPASVVKVAAICAPLTDVTLVNSATFGVAAGGTGDATTVSCPANQYALGGGGDPSNVMTEVLLSSTPVYPSAPYYPSARDDGTQPGPTGLDGAYRSYASGSTTFKFGAICVPASSLPNTTPFAVGPSMSASWFNPGQSGHGITLEFLNATSAWMCWFTFDLVGNRAWICGIGTVGGNTVSFTDAFVVNGGKFPPLFDPAAIAEVPWGSVTIAFTGCNSGTMSWTTSTPNFTSGSMPLSRLTSLWGNGCT